ncbi:MAG: prepilin-type N-terminal cleavage/methylation domain-containing protein [Holosporales bacterium]|jgi:prepilin-type N-terminal cleavage/methylation domain-containing protein|nr:prepilin-type N-terminal cleavage/methylation domain-containing protein [Holosporales bacterium]
MKERRLEGFWLRIKIMRRAWARSFHFMLQRRLDGFSLIEISIVLVIVGVMIGSIFKGRELLTQVKIKSSADGFANIQTLIMLYSNTYDGKILDKPENVWSKLAAAELLLSSDPPLSKLGGTYSIVSVNGSCVLRLGGGEHSATAILTRAQAFGIYARLAGSATVIIRNKSQQAVVLSENDKDDKELYTIEIVLRD